MKQFYFLLIISIILLLNYYIRNKIEFFVEKNENKVDEISETKLKTAENEIKTTVTPVIDEQELFHKSEFYNELTLRIVQENYTKENLNMLTVQERITVLDKLARINYYLPLDIFKDKSFKDVQSFIENKKMALNQSREIIDYYLRSLTEKQQQQIIELLLKQYVYIPIIYFNNLSYVNIIKYLRKLLNPEYKYPMNVFNENKIYSKEIFNKQKNKELNKYFRPVDSLERPIELDNKTKSNYNKLNKKIDNDIELVIQMLSENKKDKLELSKDDKMKREIINLNNKLLNQLESKKPRYEINYDVVFQKIQNNKDYVVEEDIIEKLKKSITNKRQLLEVNNNIIS